MFGGDVAPIQFAHARAASAAKHASMHTAELRAHIAQKQADVDPFNAAVYAEAERMFVRQLQQFWSCPIETTNSTSRAQADLCADSAVEFPAGFDPRTRSRATRRV